MTSRMVSFFTRGNQPTSTPPNRLWSLGTAAEPMMIHNQQALVFAILTIFNDVASN